MQKGNLKRQQLEKQVFDNLVVLAVAEGVPAGKAEEFVEKSFLLFLCNQGFLRLCKEYGFELPDFLSDCQSELKEEEKFFPGSGT